jgi:ubiquinone/menaquinone biosynthesis C-methylase UbiE
MSKKQSQFIPALRYDWLTRLYDPITRLTTRETAFKRRLVDIAHVQVGHHVLDLGCGTGTLALLIQKTRAGTEVFGVDGDLKVLKIAQGKAVDPGSHLLLNAGLVFELPYPTNRFDRVLLGVSRNWVLHQLWCKKNGGLGSKNTKAKQVKVSTTIH